MCSGEKHLHCATNTPNDLEQVGIFIAHQQFFIVGIRVSDGTFGGNIFELDGARSAEIHGTGFDQMSTKVVCRGKVTEALYRPVEGEATPKNQPSGIEVQLGEGFDLPQLGRVPMKAEIKQKPDCHA